MRDGWTYPTPSYRGAWSHDFLPLLPEELDEWPDGVVHTYTRHTLPSEWDASLDVGRDLLYVTHTIPALLTSRHEPNDDWGWEDENDYDENGYGVNAAVHLTIEEHEERARSMTPHIRPLLSLVEAEHLREDLIGAFAEAAHEQPLWLYEEWEKIKQERAHRRSYADLFKADCWSKDVG